MQRQYNQIDIDLPPLTDTEITDLVEFLHALSGEQAKKQDYLIPDSVPSGLPIDRPLASDVVLK